MGTHLRVLSESFPMEPNNTGFRWVFFKNRCILVLWVKVDSELEGLRNLQVEKKKLLTFTKKTRKMNGYEIITELQAANLSNL